MFCGGKEGVETRQLQLASGLRIEPDFRHDGIVLVFDGIVKAKPCENGYHATMN
jgi:hypothetical protein